jgi:hypothetical protein
MSRNTRARRKARKARPKLTITPAPWSWGNGPPLTEQERARVLARYACMKHRGVTFGFVPMLADGWVKASTPEELVEGTRQKLLADSKAKPEN